MMPFKYIAYRIIFYTKTFIALCIQVLSLHTNETRDHFQTDRRNYQQLFRVPHFCMSEND